MDQSVEEEVTSQQLVVAVVFKEVEVEEVATEDIVVEVVEAEEVVEVTAVEVAEAEVMGVAATDMEALFP